MAVGILHIAIDFLDQFLHAAKRSPGGWPVVLADYGFGHSKEIAPSLFPKF
jgi:hypothetical protein